MRIFGIGTDIVECARIARMLQKHGETFLQRVFTEKEIAYCRQRKRAVEHFAGRWAAKEAVFKCLGTGWARGMCWTDVEITHDRRGQPHVCVHGAVEQYLQTWHIATILISISHCRRYATACAIALLDAPDPPMHPSVVCSESEAPDAQPRSLGSGE